MHHRFTSVLLAVVISGLLTACAGSGSLNSATPSATTAPTAMPQPTATPLPTITSQPTATLEPTAPLSPLATPQPAAPQSPLATPTPPTTTPSAQVAPVPTGHATQPCG